MALFVEKKMAKQPEKMKPVKKQPEKAKQRLTRKDYDKLRRSAYEYVVMQGCDQKETAEKLHISEPTVSKWSQEGHWREEREARQQCHSTDADNTRKIIRLLSENRLELETDIREAEKTGDREKELKLREQARGVSDEISKHNKTLQTLDKENRITLGVYIDVMEDIFDALRHYDDGLFANTLDFQSQQVRKKMIELG